MFACGPVSIDFKLNIPDNKVYGANMGPIWGRQDPGGPHVGPMKLAIWDLSMLIHVHLMPMKQHWIPWISNHMPSIVWNEITYPFLNFNG